MHLDYEAQYEATTNYVAKIEEEFDEYLDILHVCVPFKVTTCTSMFQSFCDLGKSQRKTFGLEKCQTTL